MYIFNKVHLNNLCFFSNKIKLITETEDCRIHW